MSDPQYNYTLPVCHVHVHPANWTWQLLQLPPRFWRCGEPLPLWWADDEPLPVWWDDELLPLWSCLPVPPAGANPAADRSPALPSAAAGGAWGPLTALSRWLGPFSGWPWFTALTSSAPTAFPPGGITKFRTLTSLSVRTSFGWISHGLYGLLLGWRSAMMAEWLMSRCSLDANGMGWKWSRSGSLYSTALEIFIYAANGGLSRTLSSQSINHSLSHWFCNP